MKPILLDVLIGKINKAPGGVVRLGLDISGSTDGSKGPMPFEIGRHGSGIDNGARIGAGDDG